MYPCFGLTVPSHRPGAGKGMRVHGVDSSSTRAMATLKHRGHSRARAMPSRVVSGASAGLALLLLQEHF